MSPTESGAGARQGRDLDPHRSPVQAFAWALVRLREEKKKNAQELARELPADKSTVSRMTDGITLPEAGRLQAYVRICGVEETAPWAAALERAQAAGRADAGDEALEAFAQALVDLCATDLPNRSAGLGSVQVLVAAWSGAAGPVDTPVLGPEDGTETGKGDGEPPLPPPPPARRRWRKAVIAAGVAIVLIGAGAGACAVFGDGGSQPSGSASQLAACSHPTQTMTIASSTDKSAILGDLARGYGARSSHGRCVKVAVDSVDSGTAMQALADGWTTRADGPAPDVWSPASQVWLQIDRQRAAGKTTLSRLPQTAGPSIVTSPLTIAMPEPTARRLGWPTRKLSWTDLANYAQKPGYRLGKTNPEYSTSGLNATIAAFYTQTGTTGELVPSDLDNKVNQQKVSAIEKAAVHYGDTTLAFLANLRRYDDAGQATSYISAVTVEENSVVAYNQGYPCGSRSDEPGCKKTTPPHTKLVAFYPTNDSGVGTIYSDHPYIELNGLSAAKRAVADDFQRFLTSTTALARFAGLGFRTTTHQPTANITRAHGTLPDVPLPQALQAPPADVLDKLLTVWRQLRKPANVLVVMDTSGSMNQNAKGQPRLKGEPSKLDLVKQAHGPLLDGFTDRDRVGLWHFSATHVTDAPLAPMGAKESGGTTHRAAIAADIAALRPDAATALYTTIDDAVQTLRDHYDTNAINAVVVLTDGRNETAGGPTLEGLLNTIGDPNKNSVRVFTIAYGADADTRALQQIADATHARAYQASNPDTINNVLTNVISNF